MVGVNRMGEPARGAILQGVAEWQTASRGVPADMDAAWARFEGVEHFKELDLQADARADLEAAWERVEDYHFTDRFFAEDNARDEITAYLGTQATDRALSTIDFMLDEAGMLDLPDDPKDRLGLPPKRPDSATHRSPFASPPAEDTRPSLSELITPEDRAAIDGVASEWQRNLAIAKLHRHGHERPYLRHWGTKPTAQEMARADKALKDSNERY